ncbi:hypothetical protein BB561_002389 [Smittium simulii]|uniref:Uncharacterized protein n=1 Tax=Smittium simulii TaxID=133385 RepID=A0A2T9YQR7_9FUNG|nr:hypothetical protein BB561_002393 [Smittium simulii]PVU94647.1 hypothetical protein BB561_002389 [Smittium simulii]
MKYIKAESLWEDDMTINNFIIRHEQYVIDCRKSFDTNPNNMGGKFLSNMTKWELSEVSEFIDRLLLVYSHTFAGLRPPVPYIFLYIHPFTSRESLYDSSVPSSGRDRPGFRIFLGLEYERGK